MNHLIHITTSLLESRNCKLSDLPKVTSGRAGIWTRFLRFRSLWVSLFLSSFVHCPSFTSVSLFLQTSWTPLHQPWGIRSMMEQGNFIFGNKWDVVLKGCSSFSYMACDMSHGLIRKWDREVKTKVLRTNRPETSTLINWLRIVCQGSIIRNKWIAS